MSKQAKTLFLSLIFISLHTQANDSAIRINQAGYLPDAQKKAVYISKSTQNITSFSIHDALTGEKLGSFNTVKPRGEFMSYKNTCILDFSDFRQQGAFYILAGATQSPVIFINKNVYLGSADFLLNYMRQQRCGYNPSLGLYCHQHDGYEIYGDENTAGLPAQMNPVNENIPDQGKMKTSGTDTMVRNPENTRTGNSKFIDVRGGWHDASDYLQYGTTSANAIFQMLFAYHTNPSSFTDEYDEAGKKGKNGIPDILDEAKWGLDWLLKMYPDEEHLYHQIADDRDHASFRLPSDDKVDYGWGAGTGRPVYRATGKPQGLFSNKNRSTGIASIAGKYSSAMALGAQLFAPFNSQYAGILEKKALQAYLYGKNNPGVCQTAPGKSPYFYEEENWVDDMQLAAIQLYQLTNKTSYLNEAATFGRMEPVTPWMCSDTARHYQWYPFVNLGHYELAKTNNPRYSKEFLQNMLNGIQRVNERAKENPFNMGVPFIWCSNNLVVALATQCRLYRTLTNDSAYLDMETSLVDWLFGCNPWGTSMVVGFPVTGDTPTDPHSALSHNYNIPVSGGLVDGPVYGSIFKSLKGVHLSKPDPYADAQSDWAVYHDDFADYSTNEPTMDGTASLTYLLSDLQKEGNPIITNDKNTYNYGAITRTDKDKKRISLIFSGHEFADGYETISRTLKKLNIKASFFFTGDFYRQPDFAKVIKGLKSDGHYLGAHSDKHILYCSWEKRDSLLVSKTAFLHDLKNNYSEMKKFGIKKNQASFYLPPYEWYNDSISIWCREAGLTLINFTPGTLSNADYSIPAMNEKYHSSDEIYKRILKTESNEGLNGHILLFHIGTDQHRTDKMYNKLYDLLTLLTNDGYEFVDLNTATGKTDTDLKSGQDEKQKRKN